MAPEMVNRTGVPSAKCDIWAVGAIVHELATGERTFTGNAQELTIGITKGPIRQIPNTFSDSFRDLVAKLLERDPDMRYTAKEAMDHPWFEEIKNFDDEELNITVYEGKLENPLDDIASRSYEWISSVASMQ